MLEVIILWKFMDFVIQRIRLLYKWSMYLWKLVLMR